MTKPRRLAFAALAAAVLGLASSPASAQPRDLPETPAFSAELPPGISVRKTPIGNVYVDAKGRTLYGMDTSVLSIETRTPNAFCSGACAERWEPVAPPPGAPPAPPNYGALARFMASRIPPGPDWTSAQGATGPQLMFKRSNLVFTHKGDKPGSVASDGAEDGLWNVLRHIPPVPKLAAPAGVVPIFVEGEYALADGGSHILFTMKSARKCAAPCTAPMPFRASLIGRDTGDWTISRGGDFAQWQYRGKAVFVSNGPPKSTELPRGAAILHPDPTDKRSGR